MENLSYKKINNNKYKFQTPNFKLVLEKINKKKNNLLSYKIETNIDVNKNLPYQLYDGRMLVYLENC